MLSNKAMTRYIVVGILLGIGLLVAVISFVARRDRTEDLAMVRLRQQVRPTRLGFHDMLPQGPTRTWTGILLDAGCPMREAVTPGVPPAGEQVRSPEPQAAEAPPPAAPAPVPGDPQREDVLRLLTPDLRARQMDMSCAITGHTRGFAIWLPDGQVKRFDEGGNTRALAAFQATPQGQAVLAGRTPGSNPRAQITGHEQGDRLVVQAIRIL
jgi:hypothetical protein